MHVWTWFLLFVFSAGSFAYFYWTIWRPWAIRTKFLRLDRVYARLDEIEAPLFAKIKITASGLKRKTVVHLITLAGYLPFVHDTVLPWLGAQDITPFVPERLQWLFPLFLIGGGHLISWLISISPNPAGEINPEVVEKVVVNAPGDDPTLTTYVKSTEKTYGHS